MTWDELRSRVDHSIRPDTEILAFHVRGTVEADDLIVWLSPRTRDPEVHTVAIITTPRKMLRVEPS